MNAGNVAEQSQSRKVSLEVFADLLEQSEVKECLDVGTALIYKALHPTHGLIILVNTSETDQNAVMVLDRTIQ